MEVIKDLQLRIKELEEENAALKRKQVDIQKAKELYLKIFEDFPALIWRSRLDKLCDYFNRTWLEFTGRTFDQEFGNGWTEGVHPDDFQFCVDTYVNAFEKREAFLMEYRLKDKFGRYRWIRDFGRPFYDLDDSFSGYIGSCYDITENKEQELKLKELNATKDKFFAIIAHDLRNPFNNVLGLSSLLIDKTGSYPAERVKHVAGQIYSSSRSIYSLLENLLKWSESQIESLKFNPEEFDPILLMEKVIEQVQFLAQEKSITFSTDFQPGLQIYGDKDMIGLILRNLIVNSIKFSYANSVVFISAKMVDCGTLISVKDTGIGLSEDIAQKLFKMSENPSTSGTENEKGSGLGLILCKEFIDKHNGEIWAEGRPGNGSTFSFILPPRNGAVSMSAAKNDQCYPYQNAQ